MVEMHCGANTNHTSSDSAVASYMFALAYAASAATYHLTVALGG